LSLLERVDRAGDRFEDAWAAGPPPVMSGDSNFRRGIATLGFAVAKVQSHDPRAGNLRGRLLLQ
jgi:hypothetical protein